MKKLITFALILFFFGSAYAGNHIKCYFNKPVDTTVSTGVNAVYLNNCIADTLIAYLNRAQYSLDICIYDFDSTINWSSTVADTVFAPRIAAAINNAYARGVKVRYIYDGSSTNSGTYLIDTNIYMVGSPQGTDYNIMHNKFVVIDAKSHNPADPIVWTGCLNWYTEQFNWDYNNVVVIQDSALAAAYTAEFNMMWGDTSEVPDSAASKFGMYKTDLGLHNFTIDGHHVELYFSPSDGTDSHIQHTIESANKDLYFGMYTFTETTDADDIVRKFDSGLYVYGINDSWSNGYYPTSTFTTNLGTHFKVYNESTDTLFHNKFVIVDPSDTCSDPTVLTGSHNWTNSANTKNDENTLIIHDDTVANLYLQYFTTCFRMLGGSMSFPGYNCTPLGIGYPNGAEDAISVFPNPSNGNINVLYQLAQDESISIDIIDMKGIEIAKLYSNVYQSGGRHSISYAINQPGTYFIKMTTAAQTIIKKLLIID